MNINFIVYHDIKTEYRTQRILSVLKKIGDVKFISYSDPSELGHNNYLITGKGKRDRKSTRLNSSHRCTSRMPSSA